MMNTSSLSELSVQVRCTPPPSGPATRFVGALGSLLLAVPPLSEQPQAAAAIAATRQNPVNAVRGIGFLLVQSDGYQRAGCLYTPGAQNLYTLVYSFADNLRKKWAAIV